MNNRAASSSSQPNCVVSHSGRPMAHPNGGGGRALPDYKPFPPTKQIKKMQIL